MRRSRLSQRNANGHDAVHAAPQQLITLRIRAAFYAWALRSTCGLRRSVTFDHRAGEPIFGSFQTSFSLVRVNGTRISARTVAKDACLTPGAPERLRILACNGTYTSRQGKLNAASDWLPERSAVNCDRTPYGLWKAISMAQHRLPSRRPPPLKVEPGRDKDVNP